MIGANWAYWPRIYKQIMHGSGGLTFPESGPAGLVVWFDGADPSTLYQDAAKTTRVASDGDPVGCWTDKVSNLDATQATADNRPTFQTAEVNGLSVVEFDGSNDYLGFSHTLGSTTTVIAAVQTGGGGSQNCWLSGNAIDAANFRWDGIWLQFEFENAGDWEVFNLAPIGSESFHVLALTQEDGGSNTLKLYHNGTLRATATPGDNLNAVELTLLGYANAVNTYYGGQLAEVLIYNVVLSDSDRGLVEDYLGAKWDITVA